MAVTTSSLQTNRSYVISASDTLARVAAPASFSKALGKVDKSKCVISSCRDYPVPNWLAVVSTDLASCTS
jgi:hypothetical protein